MSRSLNTQYAIRTRRAEAQRRRITPRASRLTPHAPRSTPRSPAFTLVELLLVMTVLIMAISLAAPSLGGFFRSRNLEGEGRRLLALVHAGQSRAVSEGAPMVLWVDAEQRTYGLEEEPGWVDRDPKAEQFTLDQDLKLEVINTVVKHLAPRNVLDALALAKGRSLPHIRFLPDGSVDEASLRAVRVSDRDNTSLYLAQTADRLNYALTNHFEP
jgi:Tfp pilus assembly protein FimT